MIDELAIGFSGCLLVGDGLLSLLVFLGGYTSI